MVYPPVALERAMTIREMVLRAMSGEITWIQAAEMLHAAQSAPLGDEWS